MRLEQLLHATLRDVSGEKADLQIQSTTLVNGRLKVLDTGTWTERFDEYEQIRRDIAGDRLEVVGGVRVSPQVLLHTSEKDDELRDKALVVISRIKTIKQQQGISLRKAYLQLSHLYWARKETQETGVDTKEEESFPSRATVYRYFANEKKGLPVLIGHSTKGNRTPRYPQKLIDLIVEKAEKLYLVPKSKWTSPHFTNHLTQLAKDAGLLPAGKELNRRYVLQVIAQHACPDEDKARMDPRDVPAGKSIAKLTIRLAMPFQRVEQDALHLPFVVKTPMGISGAIYLVWAVDCYTSIILGWKLVIGAPRDSDSLACFGRTDVPPDLSSR